MSKSAEKSKKGKVIDIRSREKRLDQRIDPTQIKRDKKGQGSDAGGEGGTSGNWGGSATKDNSSKR